MKYSNPAVQQASEGIRANIARADEIIVAMKKTLKMATRSTDSPVVLTPAQLKTIESNQGKHIYGNAHPLYKESE